MLSYGKQSLDGAVFLYGPFFCVWAARGAARFFGALVRWALLVRMRLRGELGGACDVGLGGACSHGYRGR